MKAEECARFLGTLTPNNRTIEEEKGLMDIKLLIVKRPRRKGYWEGVDSTAMIVTLFEPASSAVGGKTLCPLEYNSSVLYWKETALSLSDLITPHTETTVAAITRRIVNKNALILFFEVIKYPPAKVIILVITGPLSPKEITKNNLQK